MNRIKRFKSLEKDYKKLIFQDGKEIRYIKVNLNKAWLIVKEIIKMNPMNKKKRNSIKNILKD